MKRFSLTAIVGAVLVGGVASAAPSRAAPSRAAVERLLGGYESQVTASDFLRLGAGVDHQLVAIAVDGKTRPLRRNRALAALGMVPSSEGRELLRAVVRDNLKASQGIELLDLRVAVRALGAFGPEEEADLVPLLVHSDADVRIAAAEALGEAHAMGAVPSLRLRMSVEREGAVVRALSRALEALAAK